MTKVEAERFLNAAQACDLRTLFALALASGMRAGEYLDLKWGDVDLDQGVVTVKRSKLGRRSIIQLPQSTVRLLADHRRKQMEESVGRSSGSLADDDLVFADDTGAPVTRDRLRRQYQAILREVGLSPLTPLAALRYTRDEPDN